MAGFAPRSESLVHLLAGVVTELERHDRRAELHDAQLHTVHFLVQVVGVILALFLALGAYAAHGTSAGAVRAPPDDPARQLYVGGAGGPPAARDPPPE